jgi:hypothetical protein
MRSGLARHDLVAQAGFFMPMSYEVDMMDGLSSLTQTVLCLRYL